MERALLAGVEFDRDRASRRLPHAAAGHGAGTGDDGGDDQALFELRELASGAGAEVVGEVRQQRPAPEAATLMGAGKVRELAAIAAQSHADVVIFNNELTPTQQRNLERTVGIKVIARTQLILDIFARHARTREGHLQVELAQLQYLLPRLTGRGQAMSRLGGGIGTRGPGETQLETDRRRIHQRIKTLRQSLERVRAQRGQQRRKRESVPLATVALVGYTNAGKSTLFNRLCGADVLTSRRMFATLDPTIRALVLPSKRTVLLSDTVGFVRDLPHTLISAFRATLEEVTRASLLLVVSDASDPQREERERQVEQVLQELRVDSVPRIRVWNKADLLPGGVPPVALSAADQPLGVSALTGVGIADLVNRLDRTLSMDSPQEVHLRLPHPAGKFLHLLHEHGQVLRERHLASRVDVVARIPASLAQKLAAYAVA